MSELQEIHEAPQKSATQRNGTAELRHQSSTYYKTLVRSGYAPVNALQMYYEIHGTVTARPLVTIHPWLGLANVFPSLTRNRQLIAVELQGHGRTADSDRPISFEQHADDIAALLKYLNIPQVDIFGESLGGTVAVQMAIHHPGIVRRVAIYGSILGKIAEVVSPESMAQFMSLTPDHRSIQFERESYESVAPDPRQWSMLFAKTGMAAGMWKGFSRDELTSIKAPVLIAAGDHDVLVPPVEHHLEMSRLIPNAQLAVIPDAGHFVLYEDPEKLLPIVANFLDQPASTVPFATTISGYHPGETR
jgi:pimeloyl-ACP methyl ester carboxylesterase